MEANVLLRFKTLLVSERDRLIESTRQSLTEDLQISTDDLSDETDLASAELSQSLVFKLRERERQNLNRIQSALLKIQNRTFGICDSCEEDIELKRLEARPYSKLCLSCQEQVEHREKVFA